MKIRFSTLSLGAVSVLSILPSVSVAQSRDTWNAAAVASAAVAVYGLSKHDSGLTVLGAAGAIYSATRASDSHGRRRDNYCPPIYGNRRGTVIVVNDRRDDWQWRQRERERLERERCEREQRQRDRWARDHRNDRWDNNRWGNSRISGWERTSQAARWEQDRRDRDRRENQRRDHDRDRNNNRNHNDRPFGRNW